MTVELGERLARKKTGVGTLGSLLVLALIGLGVGGALTRMLLETSGPVDVEQQAVPLGLLGTGVLCLALFAVGLRLRVDLHERGVIARKLFGEAVIPFDEVKAFSLREIRGDADLRTGKPNVHSEMSVTSSSGARVSLHSSRFGGDAVLWRIRDELAELLAKRLEQELARQGEVRWTTTAKLTSRGVVLSGLGMLGKGSIELTFDEAVTLRPEAGWLSLNGPDGKTAARLRMGDENFWPGYLLLQQRMGQRWRQVG